jgi:hypothetical protein
MAAFEVIALDTATPQLRAPGAGDTYTHPRQSLFLAGTAAAPGIAGNSDDNTGMLWPAADTLAWATGGSERMRLDSSGNLGLGTVPGAYAVAAKVLDFTYPNFGMDANGSGFMSFNARNSTGSTWVYKTDDNASRFEANLDGSFRWYTAGAAPGTAGNAISFTQAMTLDASGNLLVGGTSVYAATVTSYGSASRSGGIGIRNSAGTAAGGIFTYAAGSGSGSTDVIVESTGILYLSAGGTERARIPAAGGMVVGTAALATNATNGFLYVPTCAGTPTGTPTTQTGTAPIVVDTTNNKLYFYSGGQWRDAGP